MPKPVWEDDSKVSQCPKCRTGFGWSTRKHHCRGCGKVFCNKCSTHSLTIPRLVRYYGNEPVRVCDTCFYKEKHAMMKEKRDAGIKKFSTEPKIVIPPRGEATPKRKPSIPSIAPTSATNTPKQQPQAASFFALPTSVRKDVMSKNIVNSIFDDDIFSAAPKIPTKSAPLKRETPAAKPVTARASTGNISNDIFGPASPTYKPVEPSPKVSNDIPEPEPFPDISIPAIPRSNIPKQQTTPQPVAVPPKVDPVVIIEKPVAPVVKVEVQKPVETKVEPVPSPIVPVQPSTPSVSVSSLPSPFSEEQAIPPRDGGIGETEKVRQMQEKLFFRYVNAYLSQRGFSIASFDPDFLSGISFIMLVETVSHSPLSDALAANCKINPTSRSDYYLNFHYASQHLKDLGKPLPVQSIEKILDGDISAILDLVWAVIFRFEVEPIRCGEDSGIGAIFSWTRQMIEGYPVEFYDFRQSFENGLIFNSIIHRFNPNVIDFSILYPTNSVHNLKFAFDIANQVWGIPMLLDPEDTSDNPDDVCVIIYLAFYCTYLS